MKRIEEAAADVLYHARLYLARTDIPATLSVCDAEVLLFHCECAIRLENSQN